MRTAIRLWAAFLAATLWMVASGPAEGQPPPPPVTPPAPAVPPKPPGVVVEDGLTRTRPGTLEEMLTEALRNNPDVRVAESKLREAEAQLNRARMQVMQKAVALRAALDAQQGAVKEAEAVLKAAELKAKRMGELLKHNAIDAALHDEVVAGVEIARQKLLAAKTRTAELDGEVSFLLGKHRARFIISLAPTDAKAHGEDAVWVERVTRELAFDKHALHVMEWHLKVAPGSTADRIRKALDKPVRVDIKGKPLAEVLKQFQSAHGVNFVIAAKKLGETTVTVQSEEMPLGAVLEMIEDVAGIRFAVRDYGVLATSAEPLPTGAVPLYTFWKSATTPSGAGTPKEKQGKVELEIKP
jgi:FecR-like protein